MQLQDFEFELPEELIAQAPLANRTESRMLSLDKTTGSVHHGSFIDFIDRVDEGDLLVFNNTRVMPARLYAVKDSGGKVEVLVERILDKNTALVHLKASKPCRDGSPIWVVGEKNWVSSCKLVVRGRQEDLFLVEFPESVLLVLNTYGHIPLPPYIKREDSESDLERYQTVYAERIGAVAAPTAGLHFDENYLERLRAKGVNFAYVTLHVGAGTFQPVRVSNIQEHKMHAEITEVSAEVCEQILKTKARGNKVVAIGTTSVRALESAAKSGELSAYSGSTNLFIYPGYQFRVPDAIFTNFHLPGSTLLMLCSAFAGTDATLNAYKEAVSAKYRFFSYGDAMYIGNLNTI